VYGNRTNDAQSLPEGAKQFAGIGQAGITDPTTSTTLGQKIEGARSLSGKQVTVSFWARCDVLPTKIGVQLVRNFGTGGTTSPTEFYDIGIVTLGAGGGQGPFQRYSVTGALPVWAGQSEGTNKDSRITLLLYTSCGANATSVGGMGVIGIQNRNIHIWGVQVEAGSVATEFEFRLPSEELAACRRYYQYYQLLAGEIDSASGGNYVYLNPPDVATLRTKAYTASISGINQVNTGGSVAVNPGVYVEAEMIYVVLNPVGTPGAWCRVFDTILNAEL